jgi:hypothetical protein
MDESFANLEQTYEKIRSSHGKIDSYDVVREVVNYRNYWKPNNEVNVVLLAESHVFTSILDYKIKFDYTNFKRLETNYPDNFVRFVYCLGYSEPKLFATKPLDPNFKNPGTWQYWKLFCTCASKGTEINCDPVLKGTTLSFISRINNKISVLEELRKKGVWLVDSSIVGINKIEDDKERKEIIALSWKNHVRHLVENSNPKFIVCIGKNVYSVVEKDIKSMNIQFDYIHQPQAHLTSREIRLEHQKLHKICSTYGGKA